eukprot:TRINITY_DN16322_c0_g1_i1.p1 TRINITY_DN16322_c0_g1~~TRINITY_DN16322_c0_g1_i1.p1  ORF type:complete len:137 (-),score=26.31 TRINITY_DN16322_c0_g1_i1:97-459(-)
MTTVVNVKVKHIRPQYENLKEWMEDSKHNEYIGRGGVVFVNGERFPKRASIWANPFKISSTNSREQVVRDYEAYIRQKLTLGEIPLEELLKLNGKNLGCWCHPEQCHGDILVKLVKENIK